MVPIISMKDTELKSIPLSGAKKSGFNWLYIQYVHLILFIGPEATGVIKPKILWFQNDNHTDKVKGLQ